jgi:NADH-quinone oxidoreductase subunit N
VLGVIGIPAYPSTDDLLRILPELVVAGGFLLLMLLDLVVPASRRSFLAVVSVLVLGAALASVIVGWFDTGHHGYAYYGSISYDRLALFVDGVILSSAILVVAISPGYLNRRGLHYGEYYALILGATVGMMLLAGAASLMTIFLAIELLSIALYILSGFAHTEERSQEAGLKYLLLGAFASGFLLYGMALIYGETGHVQLAAIQASLNAAKGTQVDPLFLAGVVLLFVGLAFKISAAPFHTWTPDVYQGAPTSVTTFMSVTTKVAAFAALIRVFSATLYLSYDKWSFIVTFVAIISMVVGNVAALTQNSLKRMLAYSGIAQAGYILIGVAVQDPLGTVGALYYLAAYAAMNIGAFAVITVMAGRGEDLDSYDNIRGLAFRRPYVAAAMGLFLLSLGGFPPTAGFIGKFLVFSAAVHSGQIQLAFWGIGTSAISVFYYLRVGLLMYSRPREGEAAYEWPRTSLSGGGVLLATTAGTIFLGIFVFFLYSAATLAQVGTLPAPPRIGT